MSGTKAGGAKTAQTNKKKYGKDYYKKIGSMGGKVTKKLRDQGDLPQRVE